jgi:DNA-binding GntR family transcriptional regulator
MGDPTEASVGRARASEHTALVTTIAARDQEKDEGIAKEHMTRAFRACLMIYREAQVSDPL